MERQNLAFAIRLAPDRPAFGERERMSVAETTYLSFANNRSGYKLLCCSTFIPVMEAAELWNCDDLSNAQHLSRKRTLLSEAQVRSRFVVVPKITRQRSLEVASVQND